MTEATVIAVVFAFRDRNPGLETAGKDGGHMGSDGYGRRRWWWDGCSDFGWGSWGGRRRGWWRWGNGLRGGDAFGADGGSDRADDGRDGGSDLLSRLAVRWGHRIGDWASRQSCVDTTNRVSKRNQYTGGKTYISVVTIS